MSREPQGMTDMGETLTAPPEVSPERDSPHGITGITVGGFKSIATTQSIEVRPLTILAGANSSGKSSIIQALLLLKQTLDAPYDPGPLMLDGENVTFTSADQLLSRVAGQARAGRFEVGISAGYDERIQVHFRYEKGAGFQVESMDFCSSRAKGRLMPSMTSAEIARLLFQGSQMTSQVVSERCFLRVETKGKDTESVVSPGYGLAHFISGLLHIPGLRGNRGRLHGASGVGPVYPGTFDHYVASLVYRWQTENDEGRLAKLNADLESVGLARSVRAKKVNDTQFEVQVDRLPLKASEGAPNFVNIADVGFGVPTVLPVLVAVVAAQPWQAVYIEQPELHLHPRAQVKLADVLADAATRGVRVIAETHSSLLIRGAQTLVARGELDPKLVKLHWFSRNDRDGSTEIRSADLDENGAFGEWPMDFDDVELRSTGDYLDAVELRGK